MQETELLSWLQQQGGAARGVKLVQSNGEQSLSVYATEQLSDGQQVMSIPLACCMSVESALQSFGLEQLRHLPDDEVLALHLMSERSKGATSRYAAYIR